MIRTLLVLGAGSAGLIAAITVKRKLPQLDVTIVRSPDIGVIGVGEGTTPLFPKHLFDFLQISPRHFYSVAQPTWKLGIRFIWGPRDYFDYSFGRQIDSRWSDLPLQHGYYCYDEFRGVDLLSALMAQGKAAVRMSDGVGPDLRGSRAFHIENKKLVDALETVAREVGVKFIDAKVNTAQHGPRGIESLLLDDGRTLAADFFIDASGFRSELLGRALNEPYLSFDRSLFCDRAIVGGWARTTEPILPYTLSETMDAGWSWQIEHEHFINRGYVFSSAAISDDAAMAEFKRKNPKLPDNLRVVKFRSGRYSRVWVDNVLAIGNSCGFVEPLEATALMLVCWQCQLMIETLEATRLSPTPTMRDQYNRLTSIIWDEIRDFLAVHYKFNTRLDTPFWQHCRNDTDISHIAHLVDFYTENGPTGTARYTLNSTGGNVFGIEGFLVMLVGMRVPYRAMHVPSPAEKEIWQRHLADYRAQAEAGMDTREALAIIRHPAWRWVNEH